MERSRLLVTDAAELPPRQATGSLITTLGRIMKSETVAFEYTVHLLKNGRRSKFSVKVFSARPHPEGDWYSCVITRSGRFKEESFDCCGLDGLQSHLLSFVYLRQKFRNLKQDGYSFIEPYSDSEIDPDWFFAPTLK